MRKHILFIVAILLLFFTILSLPVSAVDSMASITACTIDPNNFSQISITAQISSPIVSDDNQLYLFAVPTYADSISGYTPVASVNYTGEGTYQFSVNLNANTIESLLYSKFYIAAYSGGSFAALTDGNYITNAEVLASSRVPRTETASKKGIHVTLSIPTDIETLGVKHGFFNISFQDFISNEPTDLAYTYNGKTFYFTPVVYDYDNLISNMSKAGICVTITIINEYRSGYEYMLMPGVDVRSETANYAINTSTAQGMETVAAATHFLAERYNGNDTAYGKVDNWVVGNEVNDNLLYYYMGRQEIDTFVQEYLQSFRVIHTAVKSAYSNANVYICLQHRWNTENSTGDYGGKDFIDIFNRYASAQGNIDWGLSYHPYSFPMNDPEILNDGGASIDAYGNSLSGGEVTDQITTPLITMKNLHLLTNYFHNAPLLAPDGQVRSIILGEQGYTSYSNLYEKNEARQASNIALAYYIAEMNEDVDAFLLRTHVDENEGNDYFKFGLWSADSSGYPAERKFAYETYRFIDTTKTLEYTEYAKSALNIADWSEVVAGWNPQKFSSMGTITDAPLYTFSNAETKDIIASGMLEQWQPGYNVFDIVLHDHDANLYPDGVAVANGFAYFKAQQGIEKHFVAPLNLSNAPYLTFDAHFRPMEATRADEQLMLHVRLHSGNDVFNAIGTVDVATNYQLCLDLSTWSGRTSINTIEVLISPQSHQASFAGTFTIYNMTSASVVSNAQVLSTNASEIIDLSDATLIYENAFDFTGSKIEPAVTVTLDGQTLVQRQDYDVIYHNNTASGTGKVVVVGIGNYSGYATGSFTINGNFPTVYNGIDYAPVYAYGYYKANNPVVITEVGDDPEALLKHFVTKGMNYALQGIGDFNVLAYAKINSDLRAVYGEDWAAYYTHYLRNGISEGRTTSGIKPDDMEAPEYPTSTCNHQPGESCSENIVPATCSTDGSYESVVYCIHCNQELSRETIVVKSNGHTPGTATIENTVAATCTKGGSFDTVIKCTVCYTEISRQTTKTTATGHTYDNDQDTVCNVCNEQRDLPSPPDIGPTIPMYRLYNPNSGEHFYTGSEEERDILVAAGWIYEGIAWNAPVKTGSPIYRLFNPNSGDHHYTGSKEERDFLVSVGWIYEHVAWNTLSPNDYPQYRMYNPNADIGSHHYTGSTEERDFLVSVGWIYEGIGWYGAPN